MKHRVIIFFISTIVSGNCVLEDAEVQEWCPVKCKCGVTAKNTISADCSNQKYTSIPKYFPKLNSLYFSHNAISVVKNVSFTDENLRGIEYIDLSHNNIMHIEMKGFEHLKQLQHLNISSNSLTNVSSEAFKKLKKLTTLDLHGNSVNCIALNNKLSWVNILCDNNEGYVYHTMATAALTKTSDSDMFMSNTNVTDIPTRTENSNMIDMNDPETLTKTNINDTAMQTTTSTKHYNSTLFGVTKVTHEGVATDHQPLTVPLRVIIALICAAVLIIISVTIWKWKGPCIRMFLSRQKRKCPNTEMDLEDELLKV